MAYEAVIGLECHIQLRTRSKMFCDCPVEFGAAPNSNVCPVCLGLPGALPKTNRAAIDAALRLGLALGCAVRAESVFARKNYFYPDMPKNYQITQYDRPLCVGGALPLSLDGVTREIALTRIHAEEDTGKSFHPERHGDRRVSRVDFNRAGVPLLELVTEPVLREPAECAAFLTALRRLVRWLDISDGDMEKGQLRCDANVSIRPAGSSGFGVKTELKNLNSIKGVEKGLTAEIARQAGVLAAGGRIEQATLLYDADHDRLAVMRSKEYAHDYRYFPDPDLPALEVDEAWRESARAALPELPWARAARVAERYGVPAYDAAVLCDQRDLADYYEECAAGADGKLASNWLMTEMLRVLKERGWPLAEWRGRVPAGRLRAFLAKVAAKELPGPLAKQVFAWMVDEPGAVEELLARHGVRAQGSADELRPLVRQVIEENPGPVTQYLGGRTATLGFLVGQVMKKSGGQAVPQAVKELLEAELAGRAISGS
ncbi:MAG: Asp-tRNA(Asn)/Glu-tRNA(Gln) amidotransferase subunit GatB [Candidatus Eisenbacteria bacterium]|nr:Asp-tRNA(Asn)/Glu-tRNA(Gln) amidotransferase subunit GatB [Candidatus Eisenbacteria bacterium]